MCRSIAESGRRCAGHSPSNSSAARVMRRRRARARQRLDDASMSGAEVSEYQKMLDRGSLIYFHRGRMQSDLDAEADRKYAQRRHELFLRELGLDSTGADTEVRALRARRLHDADEHDPSRAWVREALASESAAVAWSATGASEDDLYERAGRGFGDEHPSRVDADAAAFVVGAVASA